MPLKTEHDESCFVTYTDHASDFTVVHLISRKSSQFEYFQTYTEAMGNQFGVTMKRLKCDNGSEYINHKMEDFCRQKGILLTPSSAHTPEQNGRAERKNRTL